MNCIRRPIAYTRYEHTIAVAGEQDTAHTGTLLTLVYDIPYFSACGIFPPLHIANEIFSKGTSGGGMSPGTDWEPFTLSEPEYQTLVEDVQCTPVEEIKPFARYAHIKFKFDHSLDGIATRYDWFAACCKKYRESYHQDLRDAGAMS
jgi:hypothetical protein